MGRSSPCSFLEWDSSFFDVRIARVAGHHLRPESVDLIEGWCRTHAIDCLYFLGELDEESMRLAEANDFRLVDIRVTLERAQQIIPDAGDSHTGVTIRPSTPHDVPALRAIARVNHRDSRFYADTHFPRASSDALFETWIDTSCSGYADAILVAEAESRAVGYVSCHYSEDKSGRIGLLGIAPEFQGTGLGKPLVCKALRLFRDRGHTNVSVVTQGRNFRAQRLYQRCGFLTHSLELWYHKWFVDSSPDGVSTLVKSLLDSGKDM